MTTEQIVDLYLAEVARLRTEACRDKYERTLNKFMEHVGEKTPFESLTYEQGELWLSKYGGISPKTKKRYSPAYQAIHCTVLNQLFKFAKRRGYIQTPMQEFERPRLPKPEDREVVIVSTDGVKAMFRTCHEWADEICLGLLAYMGPRRNAVSMLRWGDIDLTPDPPYYPYGGMKLHEKGNKIVEKPIPLVVRQILDRAPEHGPDDYVVPSYKPGMVTRKERKNDIIYRRVKNIAQKAGVEAHVHAIRAAFAVFFLENHRGSIKSLQELLGHESIETTRHYTRNLNRKQQMFEVVDMDWGALTGTEASDGSGLGDSGHLSPNSVPVSALSETGDSRVVAPRPFESAAGQDLDSPVSTPVSLSALSEGVASGHSTKDLYRPNGEFDSRNSSPSESASEVMAHDMEPESSSDQFPCGVEPALAGLEGAFRRRASVRLGMAGTRHYLRHGTT